MNDDMKNKIKGQLILRSGRFYCRHGQNKPCAEYTKNIKEGISGIIGDISGIKGDVSYITGDVSGIIGGVGEIMEVLEKEVGK